MNEGIAEGDLVDYQFYVGRYENGEGEIAPIRARVRKVGFRAKTLMAKIEILEENISEWNGQVWTVPVMTLTGVARR